MATVSTMERRSLLDLSASVRSWLSAALMLVGVGLFVFYFFSLDFSAEGGEGTIWGPGWHVRAGYESRSRAGLAAGAVLMVGGLLMRKAAATK